MKIKNIKTQRKELKAIINKKLSSYSAVAGAVVALSPVANANIIYTDIVDVILNTDSTFYNLDLNNDATNDFVIGLYKSNPVGYVTNTVSLKPLGLNAAYASSQVFGTGTSATTYYLPKAMNLNVAINNGLNWVGGTSLIMGYYYNSGTSGTQIGNWLGKTDKYLGLKLVVSGQTYFGWARLDVAANAGTITIKDFAYENIPNQQILSGQKPTGIEDDILAKNVSLYGFENTININFQNGNIMEGQVTVFNILGQEIHKAEINDNQLQITIDEAKGSIYLVRIELSDGTMLNRKIYLKK